MTNKLILDGKSYAEVTDELDCSLKFRYRQFGAQRDRVTVTRERSPRHLPTRERKEIRRGLSEGASFRTIASQLCRAASTISREVLANGGRRSYRAWHAEDRAAQQQRRSRLPKLAANGRLRLEVEELLGDLWSPQQISQHLQRACAEDATMRVSHETIDQARW